MTQSLTCEISRVLDVWRRLAVRAFIAPIVSLVVTALVLTAEAQKAEIEEVVKPGSILIKFRDSLTECAHCLIETKASFESATTTRSTRLDRLNMQFGVKSASSHFMERCEMSSEEAKVRLEARIAAVQDKFPRRTARIPQGSPPPPNLTNWYEFEIDPSQDPFDACRQYLKDSNVEACQPNFVATAKSITSPNDPFYNTSGSFLQSYRDLWGHWAMRVSRAWQTTRGAGIVVAVIDTGLDLFHEDVPNLWLNGDELVGGGDDDGNGYVDDFNGWDFISNDNWPFDLNGHGTHVAGTIAAQGDNGVGIIGIAPEVVIMPLRALNAAGNATSSSLADALAYAALNGADVVNGSWGCKQQCPSNPVVEDAVRLGAYLGSVIVLAAGNEGLDVFRISPQNMDEPFLKPIVVAASDHRRRPAVFGTAQGAAAPGTNFGQTVEIAAPGGGKITDGFVEPHRNVVSLLSQSTHPSFLSHPGLIVGTHYIRQAGTSMAAPHVAGVAALLADCNDNYSTLHIRHAVQAAGRSRKFTKEQIGFGQLMADRPLPYSQIPVHILTAPDPHEVFELDPQSPMTVPIQGQLLGEISRWEVLVGDGTSPSATDFRSLSTGQGPANGTLTNWDISAETPGFKTIVLESVVKFRVDGGYPLTCGGVRPTDRATARRLRTTRYVAIVPETITVTSDQNYEHNEPTISGSRVAAVESAASGPPNSAIYTKDTVTGVVQRFATGTCQPSLDPDNSDRLVYAVNTASPQQIRYHKFSTGEDHLLSGNTGLRSIPVISGSRVVWREGLYGIDDPEQIVAYDLATASQAVISDGTPGAHIAPAIHGNRAVWVNDEELGIRYHNFSLGQTSTVVPSTLPLCASISGDWIVWKAHEDEVIVGALLPVAVPVGHIYAFNLSTLETRQLTSEQLAIHSCPQIHAGSVTWTTVFQGSVSQSLFAFDLATDEDAHPLQLTFPPTALSLSPDISDGVILFVDSINQIADQLFLIDLNSF